MLQSFININKIKDSKQEQVLKSSLFYNENIKIGGSYILLQLMVSNWN